MSEEELKFILPTEDMKTLLNYAVSEDDTKKYQEVYDGQIASGTVEPKIKFQYAWCLVHSQRHCDVKKGAHLFEEIFKEGSEEIKRDSLFYLVIAETRQKNYCTANKYVKAFLSVEPTNVQAQQLDTYIQQRLKKDGITGMALFGAASLFGGAVAVVVGTVAIGAALAFALTKKKGR